MTSWLSGLCYLFFVVLAPLCCAAEKVAITFDDLPLNGVLPMGVTEADIAKGTLKILRRHRMPQVFGFINAKKLENNPNAEFALQLWASAGQRLGNHTYSHLDLHRNDVPLFTADIERNEDALRRLDPNHDWRWLRYPYLREGNTLDKRRDVRTYLRTHRYRIAQVTIDYEDYLWNSPFARCVDQQDAKAIEWLRKSYLAIAANYIDTDREMAQLVYGRKIDHVLLLHLGAFTETILPDLLALLKDKGLTPVTLEDAQSDTAYRADPDAGSRYGGTLLEQFLDARKIPYPTVEKKPVKTLDALCR